MIRLEQARAMRACLASALDFGDVCSRMRAGRPLVCRKTPQNNTMEIRV
jgi:hypothetical protein